MSFESYVLGRSPSETARLRAQGELYADATRHLLVRAGIGTGMRVLDVGCGTGDVALPVAELVGPTGRVLAVDEDPDVLAVARERAARAGVRNVEFRVGTAPHVPLDGPVDAVVGRLIVLHLPDPLDGVRELARCVRPGGTVTFQDIVIAEGTTVPPVPLFELTRDRIVDTLAAAGIDSGTGRLLHGLLREAGLAVTGTAGYQPGSVGGTAATDWVAASLASLLPAAERHGVTSRAEVDPDTLAGRLHAAVTAAEAVVYLPPMIGAWARTGGSP